MSYRAKAHPQPLINLSYAGCIILCPGSMVTCFLLSSVLSVVFHYFRGGWKTKQKLDTYNKCKYILTLCTCTSLKPLYLDSQSSGLQFGINSMFYCISQYPKVKNYFEAPVAPARKLCKNKVTQLCDNYEYTRNYGFMLFFKMTPTYQKIECIAHIQKHYSLSFLLETKKGGGKALLHSGKRHSAYALRHSAEMPEFQNKKWQL